MEKTTKENQSKTVNRKKLEGVVVSDKNNKTVVVEVLRYEKHPKYGKFVQIKKRYKAHDEENSKQVGDKVVIEESRPYSKDKYFKVVS